MINVGVAVDHNSKADSLGDSGEDPQQREYGGRIQLSAFHELNSISCIAGRKELFRMADPATGYIVVPV